MFLKWLIFALASFVGIGLFQWALYTGFELAKTKTFLGYTFPNLFIFFVFWSLLLSFVMALPNGIVWAISSIALNDWFGKAWVVHLTFAATSLLAAATPFWFKFGELPTKGTLVGLALAIAGALISALWR